MRFQGLNIGGIHDTLSSSRLSGLNTSGLAGLGYRGGGLIPFLENPKPGGNDLF